MMRFLREHATFANVMSLTALFVGLGGTAWALSKDSVGSRELRANSVRASELAGNAVKYEVAESLYRSLPVALACDSPPCGERMSATFEAKCRSGRAIAGGFNIAEIPSITLPELRSSEPLPSGKGWQGTFTFVPPDTDAGPVAGPGVVVALCVD